MVQVSSGASYLVLFGHRWLTGLELTKWASLTGHRESACLCPQCWGFKHVPMWLIFFLTMVQGSNSCPQVHTAINLHTMFSQKTALLCSPGWADLMVLLLYLECWGYVCC